MEWSLHDRGEGAQAQAGASAGDPATLRHPGTVLAVLGLAFAPLGAVLFGTPVTVVLVGVALVGTGLRIEAAIRATRER
ncbi:hypothetical protein AB0L05_37075 [Nonomuraea pusilla]|uniref:hypothetical protein n=1 Tax=Nonomuraea pusilla TaxID=46177 RepID=UPI003321902E